MYTYEHRITAVNLYIKYDHKAAAVIRELGYPDRHVLVQWFKEYEATGICIKAVSYAGNQNVQKSKSK